MEAIILIGIQGAGKSTFCRERFFATHVRINLDMLKTRHREKTLMHACLETGQPFVIDNTNPSRAERLQYVAAAKAAGFCVRGFYFQSRIEDCKARNELRPEADRVPFKGILGAAGRLKRPCREEGFDELFYVRIQDGAFVVEEWNDEV